MNIGDRVRFLRGKEEGIITRFLKGNVVEVEIEDGFRIPMQRSELTLISVQEKVLMKSQPLPPQQEVRKLSAHNIIANNGIFLAFILLNEREISLYFINNSDWEVSMVLYRGTAPHFQGLKSAVVLPRTALKVKDFITKEFDEWQSISFQGLWLRGAFINERLPVQQKLRIRSLQFFKNQQKIPILDKDGYLIQLDGVQKEEITAVNPQELAEKMTTPNTTIASINIPSIGNVIDLHIEAIMPIHNQLSTTEILDFQLKIFEKSMETALTSGKAEITFVHGLGNGTLRNEIHRRLGKNPVVNFFEDAQKEKFGYGATKVSLK